MRFVRHGVAGERHLGFTRGKKPISLIDLDSAAECCMKNPPSAWTVFPTLETEAATLCRNRAFIRAHMRDQRHIPAKHSARC